MSNKVWAETVVAPGWLTLAGNALVDLQVEVGGHQPQRAVLARLEQDVGEDRDRIAALHDRLDMAEALEECRPFNRRFHRPLSPIIRTRVGSL